MDDFIVVRSVLSEEWGGTYLQVIVTLIVFALGLPAILIQTVTAPEVRRIASVRKYDGSRLLIGVMVLFVVLAFGYVLAYHDHIPILAPFDDDAFGFLTVVMVALTVCLWWWQLRLPVRDRLARSLSREAIRSFRKNGGIPDSVVSDLGELGVAVPRRQDRRVVLLIISQLVGEIRRGRTYHGDGLEQLLVATSRIAADAVLPIDSESVELGAKILLEASSSHGQDSARSPSPDMVAAIRAFVRMVEAITLRAPETTVNMLLQEFSTVEQYPPSLPAKGLFQIGRLALHGGRDHLAVMCLNHLEDIRERCELPARTLVEIYLIGLVSHIWMKHQAARDRLMKRPTTTHLVRAIGVSGWRRATDYYIDQSDFQTVSCIDSLANELSILRQDAVKRADRATPDSLQPPQKVSWIWMLLVAALGIIID